MAFPETNKRMKYTSRKNIHFFERRGRQRNGNSSKIMAYTFESMEAAILLAILLDIICKLASKPPSPIRYDVRRYPIIRRPIDAARPKYTYLFTRNNPLSLVSSMKRKIKNKMEKIM
jgi:hypothetical protein